MSLPQLPTLTKPFHERVFKNKSANGPANILPFERLVFIGASVVQLGIMNWLNDRYPDQSMCDLMDKLVKLTDRKPFFWGKLYELHSQCTQPPTTDSQTGPSSSSPSASPMVHQPSDNELFCAFIGALVLDNEGERHGYPETNRFIWTILDYEVNKGDQKETGDLDESSEENYISSFPIRSTTSNNGALTNEKTGKNGSSPGNALSDFHELIAKVKDKIEISWKSSSEGDAHIPTWTMELSINGYENKFKAVDKHKKVAKILAAELAMKDQSLLSFLNAESA